MIGPNFMEEIDCGSFFENIDDLLENHGDDEIDAGGLNFVEDNSFPPIWATGSDSLPGSDSVFSGNRDSDLSAELAVPYEDIVQLEWLSNFVEDSGGSNLTMIDNTIKKEAFIASGNASAAADANPFRTSSPVSVLESSSSCSSDKTVPHSPKQDSTAVADTAVPTKRGRPRSKRSRPAAFSPRPPIQLTGEGNSIRTVGSDSSSRLVIKISRQALSEHKKKKKTNRAATAAAAAAVAEEGKENYQGTTSLGVRKCFHCEVTKTPQWRAGPMGPKTLCNACGVRYKSGRLFPEYRPAASPTFVPSVHSNSHKKVLEMRNHTKEETEGPETAFGDCGVLIPNQNSNLDMDYL